MKVTFLSKTTDNMISLITSFSKFEQLDLSQGINNNQIKEILTKLTNLKTLSQIFFKGLAGSMSDHTERKQIDQTNIFIFQIF